MSDVLVNESRNPTSNNVNEVVNHSEGVRELKVESSTQL